MSYNIDITKEIMPEDEADAWEHLDQLRLGEQSREYGAPPGVQFLPLYEKLVGIYPCITSPEGEDSPWSDGPLKNNFGDKNTVLGISFSRVGEALPVIIKVATEMGFTVFDAQDEKIHRPVGWSRESRKAAPIPGATVPERKAWWRIW